MSWNSASPATAAADSGWTVGGRTSSALLPPPHPDSVAIAATIVATGASARTRAVLFETIVRVQPWIRTTHAKANRNENDSH
jgi:hypothetical protein